MRLPASGGGAPGSRPAVRPLTETCRLWSAANRVAAPENLAASYAEITGRAFQTRWDDCID